MSLPGRDGLWGSWGTMEELLELLALQDLSFQQATGQTLQVIATLHQQIPHTCIGVVWDTRDFLVDGTRGLLAVLLGARGRTIQEDRAAFGLEGQRAELRAHAILCDHAPGNIGRPLQI